MDFNITNFNERLKSIKLRELIVAGIAAIILGVILSEIFPAIYDSDDILCCNYNFNISILHLCSERHIWIKNEYSFCF